jgi:poly(A) polymerase
MARRSFARSRAGSHPEAPSLPAFRVEDAAPHHRADGERGSATGERHADTGLVRHDVALDENLIDADAAKIVRRLERAGFEAYLVGGCVRDLLLQKTPKDFDIATSARPEDVRSLFRNCRIIGRRFRLAHVMFGAHKVIEVATFRRNPELESADDDHEDTELLIRNDNLFGEAHEDAARRDFTINALFYDLDRHQVLDWCGGMADVTARRLRTIGDAPIRFREDPVRILRAIKFAARLDVGIDADVYESMVQHRDELEKAARPRIFEEVLRFLRGGAAHRSLWLLWELGALATMLPELSAYLDDAGETEEFSRFFRRLRAIDARTKRGAPLHDMVLLYALLEDGMNEACAGAADLALAVDDFIDPLMRRLAIPRRFADGLRRIHPMVCKLHANPRARIHRSEFAPLAVDAFELSLLAERRDIDAVHAIRATLPPNPRLPAGNS